MKSRQIIRPQPANISAILSLGAINAILSAKTERRIVAAVGDSVDEMKEKYGALLNRHHIYSENELEVVLSLKPIYKMEFSISKLLNNRFQFNFDEMDEVCYAQGEEFVKEFLETRNEADIEPIKPFLSDTNINWEAEDLTRREFRKKFKSKVDYFEDKFFADISKLKSGHSLTFRNSIQTISLTKRNDIYYAFDPVTGMLHESAQVDQIAHCLAVTFSKQTTPDGTIYVTPVKSPIELAKRPEPQQVESAAASSASSSESSSESTSVSATDRSIEMSSLSDLIELDESDDENDFRTVKGKLNPQLPKLSDQRDASAIPSEFPHREYELAELGQWKPIAIKHHLKKIGKLFADYVKPFKSNQQIREDFKQPFVGANNFFLGLIKMVVGLFTGDFARLSDGFFSFLRGIIEIATSPLAYTIKFASRVIVTEYSDRPLIEAGEGVNQLAASGLQKLRDQQFANESDIYNLLAVCNDIHRKFEKGRQCEQQTEIPADDERKSFTEAQVNAKDGLKADSAALRKYFSLFVKKSEKVENKKAAVPTILVP